MNKKQQTARGLYINGVYRGVFEEILKFQQQYPGKTFYLQPYSKKKIDRLIKFPPGDIHPWILFASVTDDLDNIYYTAEIQKWENKHLLSPERKRYLTSEIERFQKGELNHFNESENTNLISITNVAQLKEPMHVSRLIKTNDGKLLKPRTRSGLWSYVYPYFLDDSQEFILESYFKEELEKSIKRSISGNDDARRERLKNSNKIPRKISLITSGYIRNSDVIAEVIKRANGICELCGHKAPFYKASDRSLYLEVHHWTPLAEKGEDTVENAAALCPNCHKQAHYCAEKDYIRINRSLPKRD